MSTSTDPANHQRQLIVVANRLPVRNVSDRDGRRWVSSPGGLVSALAPVMTSRPESSWVGWSGSAGRAPDPFVHDDIALYPIELSRADIQLYYEGFSNGTLWPLYHDAIAEPEYHRTWWDSYTKVNRRFADSVIEIATPGATVWVHDYQLQLVPGMLRDARPDLRIGFFLHTPWPARELFLRLPWREQIVRGLLGASLIGFQTEVMAHNFRHVVPRLVEGADVADETVRVGDRTTVCKRHPIGIDVERFAQAAADPSTADAVQKLRDQLLEPRTVVLGVDRLDYTKGIAQRLRAYGELLDEDRVSAEDTVMIQIAEPSRTNVNGYAEIRSEVEQLVGEINGKYGTMTRPAVHYIHRSHDFRELIALYRLADVMLVTPFRDGMNLVAKEYVATRYDDTGALVLSEFAGAVHELELAVQVNPYDTDGLKLAIEYAIQMPSGEQTERMAAMRAIVAESTAHTWAESFIAELERE
ncbi:MAG TPA: trehalose-6-phosphate synthase [Ilumatobacter sp.]|nr:trehalose-6-phosphate synthase [Ilumatobacter sp.]